MGRLRIPLSIFKRGMRGIFQRCSKKHLRRYLAGFDFRYSNRVGLNVSDIERTAKALTGSVSLIGGSTAPKTRLHLAEKYLHWRRRLERGKT